jgi:hypothetical protein
VSAYAAEWKLETFRRFFTTRNDVYAYRTIIKDKPGYVPVWEPLTNKVLVRHMRGDIMIGSYTPLRDGTTPWVAADLDGKGGDVWGDAMNLASLLRQYDIEPICNTSQSGRGIHVRVIFAEPMEAWFARRFMLSFVEEAGLESMRDGGSFDRVFPAADKLRDGERSIGNQIAAPLHAQRARDKRGCLLLDRQFVPIPLGDATWDYLDLYNPVSKHQLFDAFEEMGVLEEVIEYGMKGDSKATDADDYYYDREREPREGGQRKFSREQLDRVMEECELFRHVRENPVLPYELWFAIGANLKFYEDGGREAFHYISSLDGSHDNRGAPRYDRGATNAKFSNILETIEAPYTCARIALEAWQCPELGDDGVCDRFRSQRTGRGPKAIANVAYFLR